MKRDTAGNLAGSPAALTVARMPVSAVLAAVFAALVLAVTAGVLAARRRAPVGRHRAVPARRGVSVSAAAAADSAPTGGEPSAAATAVDEVTADREGADEVAADREEVAGSGADEAAPLLTSVDVALSPLSGEPVAPRRLVTPAQFPQLPSRRVPTTAAAAAFAEFTGDRPPGDVAQFVAATVAPEQRLDMLRAAWDERDVDTLAALADADPPSELAAAVLAAAVTAQRADPRTLRFLRQAFDNGSDPADDEMLAEMRDTLLFHARCDEVGLREELRCSRLAVGVALACALRHTGDVESAYGVLLDLPPVPLVRLLRAQTALDLDWPARALRALTAAGDAEQDEVAGRFAAAMKVVEGAALLASDRPRDAVPALTEALGTLERRPDVVGGDTLRARALFTRAQASVSADLPDDGWADLTALLALDPDYPGARDALKAL